MCCFHPILPTSIIKELFFFHFVSSSRLAAEETIQSLQKLVDQTFQQFALDDSEEDEYYEEGSISEESLDSSVVMNENGLGSESPLPITPHPDNSYRDKLIVRHMRAQSSQ